MSIEKYKQATEARNAKRTVSNAHISQKKDGSMKITTIKGNATGLAKIKKGE